MRLIAICFLLIAAPLCAAEEEAWQFSVPPTEETILESDVDWRPHGFMSLDVRLTSPQTEKKLLCHVFFVTRQELYFKSRPCVVLSNEPQTFRLALDDLSSDWQCVNGRRPFGRDALRLIRHWGITVFSDKGYEGSVAIGIPDFEPAYHSKPEIYDAEMPKEAGTARSIPVNFRLTGFDGNPYDQSLIRCAVTSSGAEFPAYFRQDFEEVSKPGTDGTVLRQKELPYWRANVTDLQLGEHEISLKVEMLEDTIVKELGTLRIVENADLPAEPELPTIPGQITADNVLTSKTIASEKRIFEYKDRSWRDPDDNAAEYWSVPLDWISEWGRYTGLGEFDQRIAWQFEQKLQRDPGGKALPILIFSEDELDNRGVFNWKDHPFNIAKGGHLRRPTEVFSDPDSRELVLNRAVYLWRRFGSYDAVNGFFLRNNREDSKAVKWTNNIAQELAVQAPNARIYSENIGLPNRSRERHLALNASWRTDGRLSKTARIEHDRQKKEISLIAKFPDPAAVVTRQVLHWAGAESFSCDIYRSSESIGDMNVACIVRTDKTSVFQSVLVPVPDNEEWNRVRFAVSDTDSWTCLQDGSKKLTELDLLNVEEMGLLFFSDEKTDAKFRIQNCRLQWELQMDKENMPPLEITSLKANQEKVPQYSKLELTFDLNRTFNNPYDPDEIDVSIQLITPSSKVLTHPGYYHEPWELRMEQGVETPHRSGRPLWTVRITPSETGNYNWKLTAKTPSGTTSAKGSFECMPSSSHGFVQVCKKDSKWFEFSDGSFYYPIGLNLRSPGDTRAADQGKHSRANSEWAEKAGTRSYEKWFPLMEKSGQNFARIWMCPWWGALEWSPDQGPYHGLDYYSQTNAARIDRVLELAEKHGIYINLETMNHGMISSGIDHDWENSPLNKAKSPEGYLDYATEFISNKRAQKSHRNKLRYTVARWGYSTAIAWWGTVTEGEWTEPYSRSFHWANPASGIKRAPDFHTDKYIKPFYDWISDTGGYIRAVDAHPHVVSVHFSNPKNGLGVWKRPNTDVVHNNAYTDFAPGHYPFFDDLTGVAAALHGYTRFYSKYRQGKPLIIGEWGGSPTNNTEEHLAIELHTGMWVMTVSDCSGSCGFWWWNMVDGMDLYPHFKAVASFMEGEDRRGGKYSSKGGKLVRSAKDRSGLPSRRAIILYDEDELNGYVHNTKISQSKEHHGNTPAPKGFDDKDYDESGEFFLDLPERIQDGNYTLEYWNTFTGEVMGTSNVAVSRENRLIPLMDHRVDLAFKLKRVR